MVGWGWIGGGVVCGVVAVVVWAGTRVGMVLSRPPQIEPGVADKMCLTTELIIFLHGYKKIYKVCLVAGVKNKDDCMYSKIHF